LRDFIETQPLPNSDDVAQFTYGNIAKSTTRGVDTETGMTLGMLQTDIGYAYLFSRDRSTRGPLLGQPSQSGRMRLSGPLPFEMRASAIGVYTGSTPMERAADGSISSTRDPYTRVDLRISRPSFGNTDLSLGIQNAFDARPRRWADATERQVYAGVTWHARNTFNH
jgi:outer membrane receptor for ferrienterochelin and colicins